MLNTLAILAVWLHLGAPQPPWWFTTYVIVECVFVVYQLVYNDPR